MYHRRSIRLKNFDYSTPGYYYVTICTKEKGDVLGSIENTRIEPNYLGNIINQIWLDIPQQYSNVALDEYIIMPDHLHGIIQIIRRAEFDFNRGEVPSPLRHGCIRRTGGVYPPCVPPPPPHERPITLGHIVAYYKYQTTKQINQICGTHGNRFWQRNYYEHVIRDEIDLDRIREYIRLNPERWVGTNETDFDEGEGTSPLRRTGGVSPPCVPCINSKGRGNLAPTFSLYSGSTSTNPL